MIWSKVWKILVEECGASPIETAFVSRQGDFTEWRFIGGLGFGGKIWKGRGRLYVTCYCEDETSKRLAMIKRANLRLEELIEQRKGGRDES